MRIVSLLSSWLRRLWDRRPNKSNLPDRREFVYLDDISVLSLLASRTGSIPAEFTETHTTSRSSELNNSSGVGLGVIKSNIGSRIQAGQVEAYQVLRKAIIQSSFKDLYDIERSALALYPAIPDRLPTVSSSSDLKGLLDSSRGTALLIDPRNLRRGDLLEVEVELEADPIFQMATIIGTVLELMEENRELLEGESTAQLPYIRSVARLLESLLVDLVPIRGRLVDYAMIRICGRDVLIHQSLLCRIPLEKRPKVYPVILVGVAQRDLFWKDIRRLLFSQARYTVFCRLATSGLEDRWSPVKMAEIFSGIASDFDLMIQGLGGELKSALNRSVRSATTGTTTDGPPPRANQDAQGPMILLRKYAESLAAYHNREIEPADIVGLTRGVSYARNWLESVDSYRPVFAEMTKSVDDLLGVETPPEVAYKLRSEALGRSIREETLELVGSAATTDPIEHRCERFLDSEIIAIYW